MIPPIVGDVVAERCTGSCGDCGEAGKSVISFSGESLGVMRSVLRGFEGALIMMPPFFDSFSDRERICEFERRIEAERLTVDGERAGGGAAGFFGGGSVPAHAKL